MQQIIIEDNTTKQRRFVEANEMTKLAPNERAIGTEKGLSNAQAKRDKTTAAKARFAIIATKLGLPVPAFLKLVRQVGQISCPFCQFGTKVLEHLDRLGDEKAQDILKRVLVAKAENDHNTLAKLVEEFNGRC